jgi:hypothetical protein
VLLGRFEGSLGHVTARVVVGPNQGQIDLDALLHRGLGKPLGNAGAVSFIDKLFPDLGQVGLTVGWLDRGESLCSFAPEVAPAPEEIPGRAHLGGVDLGLREQAPTQEHRDFLGIDSVVFGVAAMAGFHVEGMAEDEGKTLLRTQVSQPGPT